MAKPLARKYRRPRGFIPLWREVVESPAYRDLKPPARCLLNEFLLINNTYRNGQLSISTKNARKAINVSEETAGKAFHSLAEHGFIVLTKGELWQERKAREWRITFEECKGREPTDEWKKWEPGNPLVNRPPKKSRPEKQGQNDPKNGGRLLGKQGQKVVNLKPRNQ